MWAPGPIWTGSKNLAPNGIRSPDRQSVASRYTDWATPGPYNDDDNDNDNNNNNNNKPFEIKKTIFNLSNIPARTTQ